MTSEAMFYLCCIFQTDEAYGNDILIWYRLQLRGDILVKVWFWENLENKDYIKIE